MTVQRSCRTDSVICMTAENQRLTAEKETLIRETAELKSDVGHLNERVEELRQMREALTVQFKAVSADLLKTQTENQQQSIGQILTPLKDQLTAFQKGMDDFKQVQATGRGQLDAQLKNLLEMNSRLSDEAKRAALVRQIHNIVGSSVMSVFILYVFLYRVIDSALKSRDFEHAFQLRFTPVALMFGVAFQGVRQTFGFVA